MIERGKLIKIIFEYENRKETLNEDDAQKWLNDVNGMCMFLSYRGMNPFEQNKYEWIKENKYNE